MSRPAQLSGTVSFAEFELDLRTAELHWNGSKTTLPGQPFQILITLLDRPGQLVTREELKKQLWPSDTFVDFDVSLNKGVNRLREALGDSAEHPRFVETLPKRGYRWIAPVRHADASLPTSPAPAKGHVLPELPNAVDSSQGGSSLNVVRRISRTTVYVFSVLIVAVGLAWLGSRGSSSRRSHRDQIQSLAVLPLRNLSGDPSQEFLADAATDQLITDLGRNGSVRVISQTSVMQYKASHKSLPQIAQELNVEALVEGSVVRAGDEVHITAKLIHADSDTQLWAESYTGNVRDVLSLQESVANAIAEKVLSNLNPARQQVRSTNRSIDPQAFNDYLSGVSQAYTTDGLQNKVQYFGAAVKRQPDFAAAYAELASCYAELGHMLVLAPEESFPYAKAAALKAIALDNHLAAAHSTLGEVYLLYDWNFDAAEKEIRRAIELNPNRLFVYSDYAELFLVSGRYDQAMQQVVRKESIDPIAARQSPSRAGIYYFARQYEEAIAHARKVLAANPNSYSAHLWLGLSLEQRHEFSAAIAELEKAVKLSNDNQWVGFIAHALAVSGNKAEARKILHQLQEKAKTTYVSPWWLAIIYCGLNDREQALKWLKIAYKHREHDLVFSNCWPMFDILRSDKRFQKLLLSVGLHRS